MAAHRLLRVVRIRLTQWKVLFGHLVAWPSLRVSCLVAKPCISGATDFRSGVGGVEDHLVAELDIRM